MNILHLGIFLAAALFVLASIATTVGAIASFLYAQTLLLQAALTTTFKNPHSRLHPVTQQLLNGTCPELQLAQAALKRGDKAEAQRIVAEIAAMLNAERDSSMRKQLQSKLLKAVG